MSVKANGVYSLSARRSALINVLTVTGVRGITELKYSSPTASLFSIFGTARHLRLLQTLDIRGLFFFSLQLFFHFFYFFI